MARIRTIKPEFFTSLTVASLTPEQRLTFIGLWTHCDDMGRCIDDARLIKAALWPLDDRSAGDVESDLKALTESSLIARYILNRKSYITITGWSEHQKINRPTPSKLPPPDHPEAVPHGAVTSVNVCTCRTHGGLSEDSRQERKGTGKGKEQNITSEIGEPDPPDLFDGTATPPAATQTRADVEEICTALADTIRANTGRRPNVTGRWRDSIRLMIDRDGIPAPDILAAIQWSGAHDFWRSVILSAPKLREKYQQMSLQAQRGTGHGAGTNGRPVSTTDQRVMGWLDLADKL